MRVAFLTLTLLTSSACLGVVTPDPWVSPSQDDVETSQTDCSGGETCVVVQLGCCDHCNGGVAVATNSASATDVADELSETCGTNTACTEMGCAPLTAECQSGECVLVEGVL